MNIFGVFVLICGVAVSTAYPQNQDVRKQNTFLLNFLEVLTFYFVCLIIQFYGWSNESKKRTREKFESSKRNDFIQLIVQKIQLSQMEIDTKTGNYSMGCSSKILKLAN